jgi:hypothetical protein
MNLAIGHLRELVSSCQSVEEPTAADIGHSTDEALESAG